MGKEKLGDFWLWGQIIEASLDWNPDTIRYDTIDEFNVDSSQKLSVITDQLNLAHETETNKYDTIEEINVDSKAEYTA